MNSVELDSLFISTRILVNRNECNDFLSGGVLVSNNDGTIKRIFASQQEINSWMFTYHGEVKFSHENKREKIFCAGEKKNTKK